MTRDARHPFTRGTRLPPWRRPTRMMIVTLAAASTAACSFGARQDPNSAALEVRGSTPTAAGPTAAGGILRYDGYEAAVAQDGDTVASVAARVGLSGSELGAYNGLQPETALRSGDELVLPPRPGGYGGSPVVASGTAVPQVPTAPQAGVPQTPGFDTAQVPPAGTTDPFAGDVAVAGAGTPGPGGGPLIESAPLDPAGAQVADTTGSARSGWSAASIEAVLDEPQPTTAQTPSEADLGAAAAAAAGTAPPSRPDDAQLAGIEPGAETGRLPFDTNGAIAPPPSAATPLPDEDPVPVPPASPNLGELQSTTPELSPSTDTNAAQRAAEEADRAAAEELARLEAGVPSGSAPDLGIAFQRPVEGPVIVPYNVSNSGTRNEGVDYGAPAGAPVRAAAGGEVALVSQSLGGLGTIVLVRHRNDVLTVYGRVDDVRVAKGTRVAPGDRIGVVARGDGSGPTKMHFEIRRGADSVDPSLYVGP
ncbi:MAG: peptidoglycan DD-metalloendopeptidase family protein [Pseudomonadota bacterium]